MYWLEAVRDALRLDHGVDVWRRTAGEPVFTTFLSCESDELLEGVRARGGLWTGPDPRS